MWGDGGAHDLVNQLRCGRASFSAVTSTGRSRLEHGGGRACEQTLEGHSDEVVAMAVLGDRLLTGSYDDTVRVWGMARDPGAWRCERVLRDHTATITAMVCTRDGRRVLSCDDGGNMLVWEEAP